jgi:osmotically-inducible protein OsmY
MTATATFVKNTDDFIRRRVLDALSWSPELSAYNIGVAVADGVVTLTGDVPSYWLRRQAEEEVRRIYGVRGIASELNVKLTSRRTDAEIARDAAEALAHRVFVPVDSITVVVEDGWVKLGGYVRWKFQKNLAESAVEPLRGVKGIINNIEVKPHLVPKDVKRAIEEALMRHADVDVRRISVEVEGDTVRLYGAVGSELEKQLVEDGAWSAPGVANVENNIVIVP